MKSLRYVFILCIAFISSALSAQDQAELYELMHSRGEYYFTVSVDDPKEIGRINRICSVDGTDGKTVVCYANQMEYDEMFEAGYQPFLQMPPSMKSTYDMWDQSARYRYDKYLTYSQYVEMMEGFPQAASSGRTCQLIDLGELSTSNHRHLLGVRINDGNPDGKPKFLYTSTMHGDEITGMILMLRLINELCTSQSEEILNLVNNLDIFIFPNTNPDGTYYGGNNTVDGARRYNGNGIDLNRSFPDFNHGAHPNGASTYQDEAQWMMDLAQEHLFTMSANFHGGAEVVNYPWDNTSTRHPDDAWWQYVSYDYVNKARATYSSYMTDTDASGYTNGYDWYIITGSRQDYMNYYAQCREVTIECSSDKTPAASNLPNFWTYNRPAMLSYMAQCLNGVHGIVRDAETGDIIEGVTVTVLNHDADGSSVTTHTAGDFHRPIKGGTYTFVFDKEGYCPAFRDVTVADGERVDLNDIEMTPGSCVVPNFTASTTNVALGQTVNFTDASFGTPASWSWTFEGGTPATSTQQNPTGIQYNEAGDYDVTLTITDADGNTYTETKSNYIHVEQAILMHSGTVETCGALFYDSGGENDNYGNDQTYTLTIKPCAQGAKVCVEFQQFNIESSYDFLYIYDGTSTSATQIGQYSGTTSPGTVTATNSTGALTFKFTSDYSINKAGWMATVSCFYPSITLANNGTTNSSVITTNNGNTCNVTLSGRTLYKDGNWNTLCLPFEVDIEGSALDGAGVEARTLSTTSVTGSTLLLTFGNSVSTLLAGVPYIIKWNKDTQHPTITNPTFQQVVVSNEVNDYDKVNDNLRVRFIGTRNFVPFSGEDQSILFLGDDNTLYYPDDSGNASVGACRAYFKIGDDAGSTRQFTTVSIDFDGNGSETAGIISIGNRQSTADNEADTWYTLSGRKLDGAPTQKGIYLRSASGRQQGKRGRVVVVD